MVYVPYSDGDPMKQIRPKINEVGQLFDTSIKRSFTHDQATWNDGSNTDPRLISPENIRVATGAMKLANVAVPVAFGSFSRSSTTLVTGNMHGVQSISVSTAGTDHFQINLLKPMASAGYAILANFYLGVSGERGGNIFPWNVTANNFHLTILDGGGNTTFITDVTRVSFGVWGPLA